MVERVANSWITFGVPLFALGGADELDNTWLTLICLPTLFGTGGSVLRTVVYYILIHTGNTQ